MRIPRFHGNQVRLAQLTEEAWQDVRYGVRNLSRARAFTAVIVLTLAIGMGAAVGVFAVIRGRGAPIRADVVSPA